MSSAHFALQSFLPRIASSSSGPGVFQARSGWFGYPNARWHDIGEYPRHLQKAIPGVAGKLGTKTSEMTNNSFGTLCKGFIPPPSRMTGRPPAMLLLNAVGQTCVAMAKGDRTCFFQNGLWKLVTAFSLVTLVQVACQNDTLSAVSS